MPVLEKIRLGKQSTLFRKWKRPTVKTGGSLKTRIGVLRIDQVTTVKEHQITDESAIAAGYNHKSDLKEKLAQREGEIYRISLHYEGEDPRIALRNSSDLSADQIAEVIDKLNRLDKSSRRGPWTNEILVLINDHPATLASKLADEMGQEKAWFKPQVRKLKALGLTESLEVGYRLSPRGEVILKEIDRL